MTTIPVLTSRNDQEVRAVAENALQTHHATGSDFTLWEEGWRMEFGRSRKQCGDCNYSLKRIRVHLPFVAAAPLKQIVDTILHEVAHAIVGPWVKAHGREWKAVARRVGATPRATTINTPTLYRYMEVCGECGHESPRHNRRRSYNRICNSCLSHDLSYHDFTDYVREKDGYVYGSRDGREEFAIGDIIAFVGRSAGQTGREYKKARVHAYSGSVLVSRDVDNPAVVWKVPTAQAYKVRKEV